MSKVKTKKQSNIKQVQQVYPPIVKQDTDQQVYPPIVKQDTDQQVSPPIVKQDTDQQVSPPIVVSPPIEQEKEISEEKVIVYNPAWDDILTRGDNQDCVAEADAIFLMFDGIDNNMNYFELGAGRGTILNTILQLGGNSASGISLPDIEDNIDNIVRNNLEDLDSSLPLIANTTTTIVILLGILDYLSKETTEAILKRLFVNASTKFIIFAPGTHKALYRVENDESAWQKLFLDIGFVLEPTLTGELNNKLKKNREYYNVYGTKRY